MILDDAQRVIKMKRKLLDILCCPTDKYHPLELFVEKEKDDEIIEGCLFCPKCKYAYPIKNMIPELLPCELR